MSLYKIYSNNPTMVLKDGEVSIPIGKEILDVKNTYYIEYLSWLNEGNIPEYVEYVPTYNYIELRKMEYPPLTDLADAIYWQSMDNNLPMETYIEKCNAVKLKYPKPE